MKHIIFLRHAKALQSKGEPDHERPLAPRGLTDAAQAGGAIATAGWCPTLALVSDATRTLETYAGLRPALTSPPRLSVEPSLYDAPPARILALILAVPDDVACLLVVGHNPGIAETARNLAQHGGGDDLRRLHERFPTSGLAVVSFPASTWAEIVPDGTLESLVWADPSGAAD